MDKDEILLKSRQENEGKPDELEIAAFGSASRVGMYIGGLICIVLVLVSRWILGRGDIALAGWMIYMAMQGGSNLVLYKHLKRSEKLVSGIVCSAFALTFMIAFAIAVYRYHVAGM